MQHEREINPFKIREEDLGEMIFTFKELEKERKIIEREENKNKRIWEKNRPKREGCIRKLCETDIPPSDLAINPNASKKIG